MKGSTGVVYRHTSRCLVEKFGAETALQDITQGDVDEWRLWLADHEKLADNTVRRRCGIAKQFFRAALREKLIPENPFQDMKGCLVRENRSRDYFITLPEAAAVLECVPRCPMAAVVRPVVVSGGCGARQNILLFAGLTWIGNTTESRSAAPRRNTMKGRNCRVMPIFPELRPYLEEVWDQAEPGTVWVITRYLGVDV